MKIVFIRNSKGSGDLALLHSLPGALAVCTHSIWNWRELQTRSVRYGSTGLHMSILMITNSKLLKSLFSCHGSNNQPYLYEVYVFFTNMTFSQLTCKVIHSHIHEHVHTHTHTHTWKLWHTFILQQTRTQIPQNIKYNCSLAYGIILICRQKILECIRSLKYMICNFE